MPIVGDSPESGVRVDLARPRDGGPPWHYEGVAVTPDARLAVTCEVTADGEVRVTVRTPAEPTGDAPPATPGDPTSASGPETAERIRLLVRAAYKHAQSEGQPPPRRIARWRA